jgi:hypothetical protein
MKTTISDMLTTAKMSPSMVAEKIDFRDSSYEASSAYNAIQRAEKNPNPYNVERANVRSQKWINKNEDEARKIIQIRIDVQAATDRRQDDKTCNINL